ncbi:MAG: sugar phosphate isomerase/epimerase [Candidatus Latescibacteria bacterium]|nr:sugar phosphate isomerase/epimerase [Candidatus Latescibacterota bacterium]
MKSTKRRDFLTLSGIGAAATLGGVIPETALADSRDKLTLGMASYTFRKFGLDETIAMTKRLGLEHIALKNFHLPLESSEAEIKAAAAKVRGEGLDLYGCGVVYMKTEDEVKRAFDYAGAAGMRIIIGVPAHGLLDLVNGKVGEYDIKLAIHNHGPGDETYPSPESVYGKISDLDPRVGLCIDIGHTKRMGIDPSESLKRFFDRVHDIHIKDVSAASKEGHTVEIGRGVIDIPRFLRTAISMGYTGTLALEYEKDADDPLPGSAESAGYARGVLSVL